MAATQQTTQHQERENWNGWKPSLRRELNDTLEDVDDRQLTEREILEEAGMEWLGSGCYRNVYQFTPEGDFSIEDAEDYVLKIEIGEEDRNDGNRSEVEAWNELSQPLRENCLVPIVMHAENYDWLIMDYAERKNVVRDASDKVWDKIEASGYEYGDLKPNNIGFHDGEWKLVDYGYTWTESESGEYVVDVY